MPAMPIIPEAIQARLFSMPSDQISRRDASSQNAYGPLIRPVIPADDLPEKVSTGRTLCLALSLADDLD
jgi:hypothetical protein